MYLNVQCLKLYSVHMAELLDSLDLLYKGMFFLIMEMEKKSIYPKVGVIHITEITTYY